MKGSYLGPEYNDKVIESTLKKLGANFEIFESEKLIEIIANELKNGKIVGWFQGRMEFGPRHLVVDLLLQTHDRKNAKRFKFKN